MIIWLDGVMGVGKTTLSEKIKEKLDDVEVLDSDYYYNKGNIEGLRYFGGNCFPQDNERFIQDFRELIEAKVNKNCNKIFIITMALTEMECKKGILEYLEKKDVNILHIVLTASKETIINRIIKREKNKGQALEKLDGGIKFLRDNYCDAIWVDTENDNADEVANKILKLINKK